MNKALILGVTGQDGSYLAEYLLQEGYEVIGVARRCGHDNTENIKGILSHQSFTLIEGDVTDSINMLNIINEYRPYYIFNLAAQSHVGTSFKQPSYTIDVNGRGVLNILEAIRFVQNDSYRPRFYQASTSELWGDQYDIYYLDQVETYYQDEKTKMNPQSPYSIGKLMGYHLVKLYRKSYGIFACNGILYNHESPRRGKYFLTKKVVEYIGGLYHFFKTHDVSRDWIVFDKHEIYLGGRVNRNQGLQYPKLYLGNLDAYRDWGYAPEHTKIMLTMLKKDKPDDYVIATEESHSVKEFVEEAFKYAGYNWMDYVVIDTSLVRPSEVPYLKGDASKAKKELGWNPKVKFKDLVKIMVQHEIDNCSS